MKNLNVPLPDEVLKALNDYSKKTQLQKQRIVEDALRKHLSMVKK